MPIQPILLFDGVCNFCEASVNFVIRHDKKGVIRLASLQSKEGRTLAQDFRIDPNQLNSMVFIEQGRPYFRSTAALRVCRYFSGGWRFASLFLIVPVFIRDAVYRLIARNRYRWFGKKESCMIPTPEIRSRFIQ